LLLSSNVIASRIIIRIVHAFFNEARSNHDRRGAKDISAAAEAGDHFAEAIEIAKAFQEGRAAVLNSFVYAFVGDWARSREVSARVVDNSRAQGSMASLAGTFPLLVLGERDGIALLERLDGVEGLLAEADGRAWETPGWRAAATAATRR